MSSHNPSLQYHTKLPDFDKIGVLMQVAVVELTLYRT